MFGPLLEVEMSKKCTPLWLEAHFQVNMHKTHNVRTTFGSSDVEKVHAVVARNTLPSQNVQSVEKMDAVVARSIFPSQNGKNTRCAGNPFGSWDVEKVHAMVARSTFPSKNVQSSGPLLEVEMSKKCTPLWREAHFQVKMYKAHQLRTTFGSWEVEMSKKCTPLWREAHFQVKMHKTQHVRTTFGSWDVEKVHAVVARSTFPSQNVQSTPAPDHFWKLRCRKSARRCGAKHISKSKVVKKTQGFEPFLTLRCRQRRQQQQQQQQTTNY